MVAWWKENARPLTAFFGDKPLRKITPADLTAYQNARRDIGRAPKTINGEPSVLRQLLKHAKLWYRFAEEDKPLKNTKAPAGQALTDDVQAHLFTVANSKPKWVFAYVAATLDFFCGMRACEIKAIQWKHISWQQRKLSIRRSKTPAGWRDPSLNDTCLAALRELHGRASALGFAEPEHFLFPWHGKNKKLDPTRPMTSWRARGDRCARQLAYRTCDSTTVVTALTSSRRRGWADWVIGVQFGHVSPAMMAVYSHVRRKALDEAAKALEPDAVALAPGPEPVGETAIEDSRVMSHVTSQETPRRRNVIEFPKYLGLGVGNWDLGVERSSILLDRQPWQGLSCARRAATRPGQDDRRLAPAGRATAAASGRRLTARPEYRRGAAGRTRRQGRSRT